MKQLKTILMFAHLCVTHIAVGELEYQVSPTNVTIQVGEPVVFKLRVANRGTTPVEGVFLASDRYGLAGTIVRIGLKSEREWDYKHYQNDFTGIDLDMVYRLSVLKPREMIEGVLCVMYDGRRETYVFADPGEHEVIFKHVWQLLDDGRPSSKIKATVTVLGWNQENDKHTIEASKLWMQREIAYAFQKRRNELSPERIEDLRRLTTEYKNTVYAKWAAELLEWIDRAQQQVRVSENRVPPPRVETAFGHPLPESLGGLEDGFRVLKERGRYPPDRIEHSIRIAKEYLEAEGSKLKPDDYERVQRYLEFLRELLEN